MRIEAVVCPEQIEVKLETKHAVTCLEAREVLVGRPRIRFAERGHRDGEDVYVAFGRTFAGRYLSVFFIYKPQSHTAVVISARAMTDRERQTYGRK